MTIRTMVWILVLCGLAWVGAMAYVSRDKRIKQLAQEHSLSEQETQALRLCLRSRADRSAPADAHGDPTAAESACVCESLALASAIEPQSDAALRESSQRASLRDACAHVHSQTSRLRTAQAYNEGRMRR